MSALIPKPSNEVLAPRPIYGYDDVATSKKNSFVSQRVALENNVPFILREKQQLTSLA